MTEINIYKNVKSFGYRFSGIFNVPGGSVLKNPPAKARDAGSVSRLGRSPGRRKWQPTSVFLPEKACGQRSLAVQSPWGC